MLIHKRKPGMFRSRNKSPIPEGAEIVKRLPNTIEPGDNWVAVIRPNESMSGMKIVGFVNNK